MLYGVGFPPLNYYIANGLLQPHPHKGLNVLLCVEVVPVVTSATDTG